MEIDLKSEQARARTPFEVLQKKNDAARKIQRAFTEAISNPGFKMCQLEPFDERVCKILRS
jgi:hypothetical protein